jgi:hypothetical protein
VTDAALRCAIPGVASALWLACATGVQTAGGWLPCAFLPIEEEARDTIARCALPGGDGRLAIEPAALRVLAERGVDPATVAIGDELHYLNAAGVAVPVLPFDNGADSFVEGRARTVRGGKVGFIDERLTVVIPPAWDFAFPFEEGAAVVCEGCTFRPVGDGHREVVGGRWGVVDAHGRLLVPVVHSREALRAIHPW